MRVYVCYQGPGKKDIYLDYLLVTPQGQYSAIILEEELLDESEVFISQCGQNHFNIDVTSTGILPCFIFYFLLFISFR